jgi:hypothetical protein
MNRWTETEGAYTKIDLPDETAAAGFRRKLTEKWQWWERVEIEMKVVGGTFDNKRMGLSISFFISRWSGRKQRKK